MAPTRKRPVGGGVGTEDHETGVRPDEEDTPRLLVALADREERIRQLEERLRSSAEQAPLDDDRAIFRAAAWLTRQMERWAPAGSRRRIGLRGAARVATRPFAPRRAGGEGSYANWLAANEPTPDDVARMREEGARFSNRPLISVLVPVYNSEPSWLEEMAASVVGQAYDHWELCLADDGSTDPRTRPTLERLAGSEPRIRVRHREHNGGIAAASNTALEMASGEFVALLDHDDVFRPHALHVVVAALQAEPDLDFLYSDEDKILQGGTRGHVAFKGEFDPDHLLSTNYVCHLSVIRRSLMTRVGGFRRGFEGSQDHDLILRATEATERIRHLPAVLYSWRQVPGSAAVSVDVKPLAWESGRRAADEALARRGDEGRAELGPLAGLYRVRRPVPVSVEVAVLVHGASAATCRRNVEALLAGAGHWPMTVIAVGSDPQLATVRGRDLDVVVGERPERRASLLNRAVAMSSAEVLVLVREGFTPSAPERPWLTPLIAEALRAEVGIAGGRIVDSRGKPLHEGFRLGRGPLPVSLGTRWPVVQRMAAVSGDLMAVRRQALLDAGGFDERYWRDLWDVDLALRMRRLGQAVVYTPFSELCADRATAGVRPAEDDLSVLVASWGPVSEMCDPYLSPHVERIRPLVIRSTAGPTRVAG
jgi:GT2 family glycosyltransferase